MLAAATNHRGEMSSPLVRTRLVQGLTIDHIVPVGVPECIGSNYLDRLPGWSAVEAHHAGPYTLRADAVIDVGVRLIIRPPSTRRVLPCLPSRNTKSHLQSHIYKSNWAPMLICVFGGKGRF